MSRFVIPAGFLVLAGVIIGLAFRTEAGTYQSVLVNLGTEIIGIVITVAVVEWFFERRRDLERARQVAWSAMHAIQHTVWVWQGGPREVDSDQVLGMLRAVDDDAPLPDFTQNLLLGLGTRSKRALHNEQPALESMPGLMNAFEELGRLNAMREGGRVLPAQKVASILEAAVEHLAGVLGQATEAMPARLIRYIDPTEAGQELRYFGEQGSSSNSGNGDAGARRIGRSESEPF